MTIIFNDINEFLAELTLELPNLGILRFACKQSQHPQLPTTQVTAIATTILGSNIVRFSEYVGDLWGLGGHEDTATKERAEDRRKKLESFCTMHKIELRRGVVTEDGKP